MSEEKSTTTQLESTANTSEEAESAPIEDYSESSSPTLDKVDDSFIVGEESEPYLGPSWAVLMLVLYALKTMFPAETFSMLWWFQMYILLIVLGVTIFTLLKRYKYSKHQHSEEEFPVKELQ